MRRMDEVSTKEPAAPLPDALSASPEDQFLLTYIQQFEAACPVCGYNLRALTLPRCPECGRELRLTVGAVEPFVIPWVLTTIFLAMAAGIGVLFLIACAMFGPPPIYTMRHTDLIPFAAALYGVAAIPLLAMMILRRRKFWKLDATVQWVVAAVAFGIDATFVLLVFTTIH